MNVIVTHARSIEKLNCVVVIYIFIKKGEEDSFKEVEPNIIIEYNRKREPIAIEILNVSR